MTVKYQVVEHCAMCVYCTPDVIDRCYRCNRHAMEPKVEPWGELPEWCFLLPGEEIAERVKE